MKKLAGFIFALWVCATQLTQSAGAVTFADITAKAGIRFTHISGATGKKYMPETFGSGCLFLDVDGDEWQDILLVNSMRWPGDPGGATYAALYRNRGDGTFQDITRGSGLDVELYGMGGAAADYDNDGRTDVFITAYGGGRLFRNVGGGKFTDVTKTSGVLVTGFSTAAMWFDYDKNGALDLFVGRYVEWSMKNDLYCTEDAKRKSYCTPESYQGSPPALFRNRGDGTFEDVSQRAGLSEERLISIGKPYVVSRMTKALGVSLIDFDADGWPDIFVANDMLPNNLYRNNGNGTFTDVAMRTGVAMSEAGVARSGMGVDAGDYDGTGRASIVIGNFSNEMISLFHNEGRGLFVDEAATSGVGVPSLLTLTFGCFFFDYDLDGRLDIFAANGHLDNAVETLQSKITYAQRPHVFRNLGQKKFADVIADLGPDLRRPAVARGAAYADIDRDGDLDVLTTTSMGSPHLYRNDGGNSNNVLRVQAVGTVSNRDGIGARVEVTGPAGGTLWQMVKTGSSYLSQSELPLTFGLGAQATVTSLRVTWPSGRIETVGALKANQTVILKEGAGVLRVAPITRRAGG